MMDFNFFAEKRLVFLRDKDASGAKKEGETVPPAKSKETPEDTAKAIQELHRRVASETFSGSPTMPRRRTHTGPALTRTLTPSRPSYRESADIAKQYVELEGQLNATETQAMQLANEQLYTQYMSPAFMLYLKQKLTPDMQNKVYEAMNSVIRQPNEFSYEFQHDKTLHIVKRHPLNALSRKNIPDNFKIVVEPPGNIVKIESADITNKSWSVDLKVDGQVPWMEKDEFNKNAPLYFERWNSEDAAFLAAYDDKELTPDEQEKVSNESLGQISGPMKDIHVAMNIDFPQKLAKLIELRNLTFEKEDAQVINFLERQKKQGTTYDDITKNGYGPNGKLQVMVIANPKFPGIYEVYTRDFYEVPMVVSYEGYIMRPTADGSGWEPDARYGESVRRKYYYRKKADGSREHQKAWDHGGLTLEEKKRMEDAEEQEKPDSDTDKYAKKVNSWRQRRQAVDGRLSELCEEPSDADYANQLQTLRDVAKAVSIEDGEDPVVRAEREQVIQEIDDPAELKKGINDYLVKEFMKVKTLERQRRNDAAAVILGE